VLSSKFTTITSRRTHRTRCGYRKSGRRGWAVLTKDDRIRYRDAETTAATAAGVALFIFTGKRMRGPAIADALVKALPAMTEFLRTHPRPFVAKVTRGSTVTLVS